MRHTHTSFPLFLASICLSFFVIISVYASEQETVRLIKKPGGKVAAIEYYDASGVAQTPDPSQAKLTALHFWATWCVPCVDELPMVDDAQDIFGKDLQVIAVALDRKSIDKVQKFYTDHKIEHLPALTDYTNKSAAAVGLKGLPGTLFLDSQGNIIARADGPLDWQNEDVVKFIKRRLK